jgi:ABC-type multidrug transport system fused ATPase/permease subunit
MYLHFKTGSIKDNILFGQAEDRARLSSVYSACSLEPDLAQWPNGEDSLIGENGVTLSGGQKQRVALARAIYRLVHHRGT